MNRKDRRLLTVAIDDLSAISEILDILREDLEERSINLADHFPNRADLINEESQEVDDCIINLADVIGGLYSLSRGVE